MVLFDIKHDGEVISLIEVCVPRVSHNSTVIRACSRYIEYLKTYSLLNINFLI